MFAILLHIYYKESWKSYFKENFSAIKDRPFHLLVNLSIDMEDKGAVIADIKQDFSEAFIIETPNVGKDIGGKLALIDLFIRMNIQADHLVLLHDKKSPQAITGDRWRDILLKIINPDVIDTIYKSFSRDDRLGIAGAKEFIMDEYSKENRSRNNGEIAFRLAESYGIETKDHRFIAGTMFWIRTPLFKTFFSVNPPLECRKKLEAGNVMDTENGSLTHSWERVFCWIATARGYKIKGV